MQRALVLPLAIILLFAGCVSLPGAGELPAPGLPNARGPFIDPIIHDHDHADAAIHALATPNVRQVGHATLGDDAATFSDFGEVDMHENLLVVSALLHGEPRQGAVVLVDVTDPAAPRRVGHVPLASPDHALDVKFDEEGEFVFASAVGQIHAIDVRDPAAPRLAGAMLPTGHSCHMSTLGVVDGVEYFFCTGDPVGLTVYRVVAPTPGERALAPVGYARPSGLAPVTGSGTFGVAGAPHDFTFQLDPVDGTPLLVVSNRGYGVRVLDVSDPSAPRELGTWRGEDAERFSNHMHTAMVSVIDGVRYLIVSPEILARETPPAVWVLDATDYAALKLVAEWWAPGDHVSPGLMFTTHQWQIADGRLYMGYYHAGVWVLDVRAMLAPEFKDNPDRPDILGYYLPNAPAIEAGKIVPDVWDLNLRNGLMYVTCRSSGLYVLHYGPDAIGDEALTGFA